MVRGLGSDARPPTKVRRSARIGYLYSRGKERTVSVILLYSGKVFELADFTSRRQLKQAS